MTALHHLWDASLGRRVAFRDGAVAFFPDLYKLWAEWAWWHQHPCAVFNHLNIDEGDHINRTPDNDEPITPPALQPTPGPPVPTAH